jgi:hypothetical protein
MRAPQTNPPPCERCHETRVYQTRMLDPKHNKRYVMFECASCQRQTWTVIHDE